MITRKVTKNILEEWYKHLKNEDANGLLCNVMGEVAFKNQLDKFIAQFPDELTLDEMLTEMREKLKEENMSVTVCETELQTQVIQSSYYYEYKVKIIKGKTRTEAITEAYNQWKDATNGDN